MKMNYGRRPTTEYLKWDGVDPLSDLAILAVDQAKFNIAYLAFPEIEELKSVMGASPQYIGGIRNLMDKQTREYALKLPLQFMRYWADLHRAMGVVPIATVLPEDYMARMWAQAHRVQARLVEKVGNVISVPFGETT